MTKQEEIREGVAYLIAEACYKYFNERTKATQNSNYFSAFNAALESDEIFNYLHSQGVVIKVAEISDDLAQTASESPHYLARGKDMALVSTEKTADVFKGFKDMGYCAVEPLIKENQR